MGALAPGQIARRDGALIDYLEPLLRERGATLDHAQSAALDRLQSLCDELAAFKIACLPEIGSKSHCSPCHGLGITITSA